MIWEWLRIDCYDVSRATVMLANAIEFAPRIAELLGVCDVTPRHQHKGLFWAGNGHRIQFTGAFTAVFVQVESRNGQICY
jgi:hypothetical protein